MDDRELEGRLRTHLHQRFGGAPVPAGLATAVLQGLDSKATEKVRFSFRLRALKLGWAATAAIVVTVGAFLLLGRIPGPASPVASSTPPAVTSLPTLPNAADLVFVVLPPVPGDAGRELANRVSDQLAARVMALGAPSAGAAVDAFIVCFVPVTDGPTNGEIKDVLSVRGDVEFVPLPASDYGPGRLEAVPGKPLPKAEPALFGWEGVASTVRRGSDQEPNALITLTGAATDAFAAYTTNNVGGQFAIVIDGVVGISPRINTAITTGEIELASGLDNLSLYRRTVAILVAGKLADGWSGATVIQVMSREDAARAAQQAHPAGQVTSSDVDVIQNGAFPRAVWRVTFSGGAVVTIDGVTGEWLSTGIS